MREWFGDDDAQVFKPTIRPLKRKECLYPENLPNCSRIDIIIGMEEDGLDIYKSKSSTYKESLWITPPCNTLKPCLTTKSDSQRFNQAGCWPLWCPKHNCFGMAFMASLDFKKCDRSTEVARKRFVKYRVTYIVKRVVVVPDIRGSFRGVKIRVEV